MATATQRIVSAPVPVMTVWSRRESPRILRIDRYTMRAGAEAAVRNLQKQVARAMAQYGQFHPSLAIESMTGAPEVWCLSGFQSPAEQRTATVLTEENAGLRIALHRLDAQIQTLTGPPATIVAQWRPADRRGRMWMMGRGHYLVIAQGTRAMSGEGSLYETTTGAAYLIGSARTRRDADARAALAGPDAQVFTVRPTWGMPAEEWTRRDPDFWSSSPVMKQRG